jgi:hypothetical protein
LRRIRVAGDARATADVNHSLKESRGIINNLKRVTAELALGCVACSSDADYACVGTLVALNHVNKLRADVKDLDKYLMMASKVGDAVSIDEELR